MTTRATVSCLCMLLAAALLFGGCASLKKDKTPPLYGTWFFTMQSLTQGELTGTMTFGEAEDGSYVGHVSVNEMGVDEDMEIKSLEMNRETGEFTLMGFAAGTDFTITGTVMGDKMTGTNNVAAAGEYSLEATRVEDSM